jgi:hypothetical protein
LGPTAGVLGLGDATNAPRSVHKVIADVMRPRGGSS